MALAQYDYPQPTGLQQLGDVLLRSSGNYANLQLRRQDEERRRAQQLADLQDNRRFAVEQRGVERGLMLEDEARRRRQGVDDATLNILLKEGWLKPTDAKNPEAIAAAADARQARLNTTREREGKLPDKLQQEADYLGKQDVELATAEAALNAKLSEAAPPMPSQAEVRREAIRSLNLAPGTVPTDADINAAMPAALEAIKQDRLIRWSMEKEDTKNQIQLLRYQRTQLRQSLGQLLQRGFVPDRPPPSGPAAGLAPPQPALRPATAAEADEAAGVTPPPAPPPAANAAPAGYGGVMGLVGNLSAEAPAARAALYDPLGAAEIGLRAGLNPLARTLNYMAGGDKRVQEGEAARAAEMQAAQNRFNQPLKAPTPAPFPLNYLVYRPEANQKLPPLRSLQPSAFTSPFAPGY